MNMPPPAAASVFFFGGALDPPGMEIENVWPSLREKSRLGSAGFVDESEGLEEGEEVEDGVVIRLRWS